MGEKVEVTELDDLPVFEPPRPHPGFQLYACKAWEDECVMARGDFAARVQSWPKSGMGPLFRNDFTALECSERRVASSLVAD